MELWGILLSAIGVVAIPYCVGIGFLTSREYQAARKWMLAGGIDGLLCLGVTMGLVQWSFLPRLACVSAGSLTLGIGTMLLVGHLNAKASERPVLTPSELAQPFGALLPAGLPTSELRKEARPEELVVVAGSCVCATPPLGDKPSHIVRMRGRDLLTFAHDPSTGGLLVSARVFGTEGKLVASIDDNKFQKVGNVRFNRPDASTLIVADDSDLQLLKVRFMDAHTATVDGIFRAPGGPVAVLALDGTTYRGIKFVGTFIRTVGGNTLFEFN